MGVAFCLFGVKLQLLRIAECTFEKRFLVDDFFDGKIPIVILKYPYSKPFHFINGGTYLEYFF